MPEGGYIDALDLRVKVGTGWTELALLSEVCVVFTRRGYVPAVRVRRGSTDHVLLVGAMSLAEPLEELRKATGQLIGHVIRVRKTTEQPTSPYEVSVVS